LPGAGRGRKREEEGGVDVTLGFGGSSGDRYNRCSYPYQLFIVAQSLLKHKVSTCHLGSPLGVLLRSTEQKGGCFSSETSRITLELALGFA